jgi:hypothetical protein
MSISIESFNEFDNLCQFKDSVLARKTGDTTEITILNDTDAFNFSKKIESLNASLKDHIEVRKNLASRSTNQFLVTPQYVWAKVTEKKKKLVPKVNNAFKFLIEVMKGKVPVYFV